MNEDRAYYLMEMGEKLYHILENDTSINEQTRNILTSFHRGYIRSFYLTKKQCDMIESVYNAMLLKLPRNGG